MPSHRHLDDGDAHRARPHRIIDEVGERASLRGWSGWRAAPADLCAKRASANCGFRHPQGMNLLQTAIREQVTVRASSCLAVAECRRFPAEPDDPTGHRPATAGRDHSP